MFAISRTVRCDGVSHDATAKGTHDEAFDVAKEIASAFPEHGPYLGVYCKVAAEGTVSVGDR